MVVNDVTIYLKEVIITLIRNTAGDSIFFDQVFFGVNIP